VENVKKSKVKREPAGKIDLLDTMLSSLVELLEEKGILTQAEYEKRIMEKVKSNKRWRTKINRSFARQYIKLT
jgi:ribosomal protein L18E